MEAIKVTIAEQDDLWELVFNFDDGVETLPLSVDDASLVKGFFSLLVKRLLVGPFVFELDSNANHLFHHVAVEYLAQLNVELQEVHALLLADGLTKGDSEK